MAKSKTVIKQPKAGASSRLQKMIDSMELVKMPVSELVPWEENPRIHGDVDALLQSMSQFGVFSPILAQKGTNRILAGHRRYKAALRDGLQLVPVILIEIDDTSAAGFTVADNAIAEQSKWDFGKLKGILDGLKIEGFDLDTTGFKDMKFDKAFSIAPSKPATDTAAVNTLRDHPMEFRTHEADELQHVAQNIAKHGFYREVTVSSDGFVLSGQEIVKAAEAEGMLEIPVKRLTVPHDDQDAPRILIGDRAISNLTHVDDRKLTNILVELGKSGDEALLGTGYDREKVAALLINTRSEAEIKDPNAAAQWVGMPDYEVEPDVFKLMVSFRSQEDKDAFLEKMGLSADGRNRKMSTCWWPEKSREDLTSISWEG